MMRQCLHKLLEEHLGKPTNTKVTLNFQGDLEHRLGSHSEVV